MTDYLLAGNFRAARFLHPFDELRHVFLIDSLPEHLLKAVGIDQPTEQAELCRLEAFDVVTLLAKPFFGSSLLPEYFAPLKVEVGDMDDPVRRPISSDEHIDLGDVRAESQYLFGRNR